MKVCNNCGTELNDNVVFCHNCGSNVPNAVNNVPNTANNAPVNHPPYPPVAPKQPISVGGWIGRYLIPFIPLVGSIVFLVMLFIWSGDTTKEDTFRNWAKAQLIVMAIVFVLTLIFIVFFGVVFAEVFDSIAYMY